MSEAQNVNGYYKIRPAGRHLITIGRDLIKDRYAAIVELVKNAYDADSPYCKVSLKPFEKINGEKGIRIDISDEGHGMSLDTVIHKWMVPSTDDKLIRKVSPDGRVMQGRKGVGRYAASLIGDDLLLETIDVYGNLTTLYLVWNEFEKAQYLEDVDVLIESYSVDKPHGTNLIIVGDGSQLADWTAKQLQNLKFELKKLIPLIDNTDELIDNDVSDFKIQLELGNFPYEGLSNVTENIEPYPLFELYDYRISGTVSAIGIANLKFENKRIKNAPIEVIKNFEIELNQNVNRRGDETYCGEVKIDFRVFDRDPASIDGLIERGLKDPNTGQYVGKREARVILDTYNGVGVYRNGFRIRPLGDAGFDWLELDKERVQNPSLKIGSDQIIGFIHIQSEEESGLEEKSARDGLKETAQYYGLQEISKRILSRLEQRRFIYRRNVGLGRSIGSISEKINLLYSFDDLKEKITKQLNSLSVEPKKVEEINRLLNDKQEQNNKIADELRQTIALYQGQATLGKVVNIILHEGRKPLGYFRNQIPIITEWADELKTNHNQELLEKIAKRLYSIDEQSKIFIRLFGKLDPLSAKRRSPKKNFILRTVIEDVHAVYSGELDAQNIEYIIDCDPHKICFGWKEDFYIVFTNLVDNSIYWLQSVRERRKFISFHVYEEDGLLIIDYRDDGPGIEKHLIESEVIFDPEFSNKTGGGSGLGLAIAGEAIGRNSGDLKAIYSNDGAFFKIQIKS